MGSISSHGYLQSEDLLWLKSESEKDVTMEEGSVRCNVASSEHGGNGLWAKTFRWLLQAGISGEKSKWNSASKKENSPSNHLDLGPVKPV